MKDPESFRQDLETYPADTETFSVRSGNLFGWIWKLFRSEPETFSVRSGNLIGQNRKPFWSDLETFSVRSGNLFGQIWNLFERTKDLFRRIWIIANMKAIGRGKKYVLDNNFYLQKAHQTFTISFLVVAPIFHCKELYLKLSKVIND